MKSGTSSGAMTINKMVMPGRYDIVSLTFLPFTDQLKLHSFWTKPRRP